MEIMQYLNETTFSMVLCAFLVIKVNNTLSELSKSINNFNLRLENLEKAILNKPLKSN